MEGRVDVSVLHSITHIEEALRERDVGKAIDIMDESSNPHVQVVHDLCLCVEM